MDVESEGDRLLSYDDECPYCNGMGKLNKPGVPDCPHCKGTGVMAPLQHGHLKNGARRRPKTGSTTL
jgi:DnaJ-class molecular chaperone